MWIVRLDGERMQDTILEKRQGNGDEFQLTCWRTVVLVSDFFHQRLTFAGSRLVRLAWCALGFLRHHEEVDLRIIWMLHKSMLQSMGAITPPMEKKNSNS